jgi:hypothetical protein
VRTFTKDDIFLDVSGCDMSNFFVFKAQQACLTTNFIGNFGATSNPPRKTATTSCIASDGTFPKLGIPQSPRKEQDLDKPRDHHHLAQKSLGHDRQMR